MGWGGIGRGLGGGAVSFASTLTLAWLDFSKFIDSAGGESAIGGQRYWPTALRQLSSSLPYCFKFAPLGCLEGEQVFRGGLLSTYGTATYTSITTSASYLFHLCDDVTSDTACPRIPPLRCLFQRPSAQDLLATVEPGRSGRASAAPTASRGYWTSRPVMDGPPPYRGLFPPYMRDVYAFLAALHQEVNEMHSTKRAAGTFKARNLSKKTARGKKSIRHGESCFREEERAAMLNALFAAKFGQRCILIGRKSCMAGFLCQ